MSDRARALRDALRGARAPEEGAAEDRAWRVVAAARASAVPAPVSRRHRRRAVQVALALALVALVVSPAGASVRHWVADRIDEPGVPHATPVLSSLPGEGSLLVDSAEGPWVVRPDGSKRRLGDWREASWSPHGLFAVVVRAHELAAVEPDGTVRWTLSRPGTLGRARWNGPDGYRIAYLEDRQLRVVDGDGTDDRRIAGDVAWVAPAWKPGPAHVVAYATYRGTVVAVRVDSRRKVFRSAGRPVLFLQWTRGRLLVTRPGSLQLLDRTGRPTWTWTSPPGTSIGSAVARGGRVAVVLNDQRSGASRLVLVRHGHKPRVLFAGPGVLAPPRWSPDGRWLLAPWPRADQWLFLQPAAGSRKLHVVANVAAQFSPGQAAPAPFPTVAGWCCSR